MVTALTFSDYGSHANQSSCIEFDTGSLIRTFQDHCSIRINWHRRRARHDGLNFLVNRRYLIHRRWSCYSCSQGLSQQEQVQAYEVGWLGSPAVDSRRQLKGPRIVQGKKYRLPQCRRGRRGLRYGSARGGQCAITNSEGNRFSFAEIKGTTVIEAPQGTHFAHTFQREQATNRWWRWCNWRWPAFFLKWFSAFSFTSRQMRNRLAHVLHGNISVRVSNVTSAVGKALHIMQLAQDGLHLLSETRHDSSIVRRLQREAVCF